MILHISQFVSASSSCYIASSGALCVGSNFSHSDCAFVTIHNSISTRSVFEASRDKLNGIFFILQPFSLVGGTIVLLTQFFTLLKKSPGINRLVAQ